MGEITKNILIKIQWFGSSIDRVCAFSDMETIQHLSSTKKKKKKQKKIFNLMSQDFNLYNGLFTFNC